MATVAKYTTLNIHNFKTQALLGWTDGERKQPQLISIDATIRYPFAPKACLSDQLQDTICYDAMIQWIDKVCHERDYKLLEHLAHAAYSEVKKNAQLPIELSITIYKVNPPVKHLEQASFTVGDWQ